MEICDLYPLKGAYNWFFGGKKGSLAQYGKGKAKLQPGYNRHIAHCCRGVVAPGADILFSL